MSSDDRFLTRREFLRTSVLGASLSWTLPGFLAVTFDALQAAARDLTQPRTGRDSPILVVVQLAGGNDGLNTVVPLENDDYRRARPRLGIDSQAALRLDDRLGLHPALAGFKDLFDAGRLAIVQGVGYPNPNRSHFRSTEIWQTASDADRVERHGWLGRYFDNACAGAQPVVGVAIGRQLPQSFASAHPVGVSFEAPESFRALPADRGNLDRGDEFYRGMNAAEDDDPGGAVDASGDTVTSVAGRWHTAGSLLDYVERVALDAQVSSDTIRAVNRRAQNAAAYPAGRLANHLKLVARLIRGGLPTRVYYVSQGGYDTHTQQIPTQQRLLGELGGAVNAFADDLHAQGNLDRVLLLTFSEFGRRVAENASGGTDHGAAAPLFLMGGRVQPGVHGRSPSLAPADLLNGDLRFTNDFRAVYAGVLDHWLQTPSEAILGRRFSPLKLVT